MEDNFIKNFRELDIPKKQAWLGMIFIGINIAFWSLLTYALALHITTPFIVSLLFILGLALAVTYGLLVLFVHRYISYFLYIFLSILLLVLYGFYDLNFIGVFLFTLILFLAFLRAQRFRDFIADFRPYHISRRFMPLFFTALAVLLAFVYNSFILQYYVEDLHIPKSVYSVAFKPVDYSLEFLFTDYERGMTITEFQNILVSGFVTRFIPGLPEGQLEAGAFPEFFGENVAEFSVEEFSLVWVNQSIASIFTPYRDILPALFIFGLFLVLRFVFLPFVWVSTGLLLLAIKILSLYNIITLDEETTVKEVPVLE